MTSRPSLLVLSPDGSERQFLLGLTEVALGRDAGCDIVLDGDKAISRRHAVIRIRDAGAEVEDLGSSNGTALNGKRLAPGSTAVLADGDLLRLGRAKVRFCRPPGTPRSQEDATHTEATANRIQTSLLPATLGRTLGEPTERVDSPEAEVGLLRVVLRPRAVAWLAVRGPGGTREVSLGSAPLTLGRDPACEVHVDEPRASRRHAVVEPVKGGYRLRDLASLNRTLVNGAEVTERVLREGDTIRIGEVTLVFKDGRDPATATPRRMDIRRPVVLVPGFGGSELRRAGQRLWPNYLALASCPPARRAEFWGEAEVGGILRDHAVIPGLFKMESFGALTDFAEQRLGYRRGTDLLEFPYDWRQDVRQSARALGKAIEAWRRKARDPAVKVVIVAHSMGGLLARHLLASPPARDAVERLICLGTPHQGSTKALLLAVAGRGLFPRMSIGALQAVVAGFPALYHLLPAYPAATLEDGAEFSPFADDGWLDPAHRRHLAGALEARREIEQESTPDGVAVTCIFGYGQKTVQRLRLRRGRSGALAFVGEDFESSGDCAVLEESAVLPRAEIHPVLQQHGVLYADPDVQRRLRFELLERPRGG